MNLKHAYFLILNLTNLMVFAQVNTQEFQVYDYSGRIEYQSNNHVLLIGSASSVSFNFTGQKCEVSLKCADSWQTHNYVALELDGKYIGRLKVEKGESKSYPITVSEIKETHHLLLFKATEASNGAIAFEGATANLIETKHENRKKIEFIGNSITCGMGNDLSDIQCDKGEWFDQHNAYWAYGPILSRSLKVDFLLSSVSGIGIYRNWNDEHIEEAIMPDVYENLYLNKDNSKPYNFSFQPDIVSICLGTNDLSDGDGKKIRLPFNEEKFVTNYINFIKTVYKHSPKARIVLLNSPMVSGDRNSILIRCLEKIIVAFKNDKKHKKIQLFQYESIQPRGCGSHPDIENHKEMAKQLAPFFNKLLNEK